MRIRALLRYSCNLLKPRMLMNVATGGFAGTVENFTILHSFLIIKNSAAIPIATLFIDANLADYTIITFTDTTAENKPTSSSPMK